MIYGLSIWPLVFKMVDLGLVMVKVVFRANVFNDVNQRVLMVIIVGLIKHCYQSVLYRSCQELLSPNNLNIWSRSALFDVDVIQRRQIKTSISIEGSIGSDMVLLGL